MRTIRNFVLVTTIVVTTLGACSNSAADEDDRSDFQLLPESSGLYRNDSLKLRFNKSVRKDEKTEAMERAAAQWNRNLYMLDSYASLDEYVEIYGQNP
ncbi:MAG: hypothetical protein J5990_06305 [Bacteroidales bacterium]|nr:hypothetical protein [Bacteroidales bacterium]